MNPRLVLLLTFLPFLLTGCCVLPIPRCLCPGYQCARPYPAVPAGPPMIPMGPGYGSPQYTCPLPGRIHHQACPWPITQSYAAARRSVPVRPVSKQQVSNCDGLCEACCDDHKPVKSRLWGGRHKSCNHRQHCRKTDCQCCRRAPCNHHDCKCNDCVPPSCAAPGRQTSECDCYQSAVQNHQSCPTGNFGCNAGGQSVHAKPSGAIDATDDRVRPGGITDGVVPTPVPPPIPRPIPPPSGSKPQITDSPAQPAEPEDQGVQPMSFRIRSPPHTLPKMIDVETTTIPGTKVATKRIQ